MVNVDEKKLKNLINETLLDFWENFLEPNVAMKSDLIATNHKIDKVATDVKDIKRRLTDLESDTASMNEFNRLKRRIDRCCPEN